MANTTQRRSFGQRINAWLDEPEGEIFRAGKWRFWFLALVSLSILNAILTASIFGSNRQGFIGSITLAVGALVAWLCVGTLHYSDSRDARLARGVSLLDSVSLCFVIGHFCFLLWAQGHLLTIQAQEAEYKAALTTYNEKAEKISSDNVRIAEETRKAAQEITKAERLRNDTAYQERRAAEAGGIRRPRAGQKQTGQSPALATSPVELEKPEKPKQSSADFLARWDAWIRGANFGELILAAITLIFIRNHSAKFNAQARRADEEWPDEIDADVIEKRSPTRRGILAPKTTTQGDIVDDTDSQQKTTQAKNPPGLQALREVLKLIAFEHPPGHFKADLKPDFPREPDHVRIRWMASDRGDEYTTHSTRAKLSILDDAVRMAPADFRARLEGFLRENGFFEA